MKNNAVEKYIEVHGTDEAYILLGKAQRQSKSKSLAEFFSNCQDRIYGKHAIRESK